MLIMSPNRLILGLITIDAETNAGARITSLEFNRCLDYLSLHGYNELDTAAIYFGGHPEAFTREAGLTAKGFSITSKIMPLVLVTMPRGN